MDTVDGQPGHEPALEKTQTAPESSSAQLLPITGQTPGAAGSASAQASKDDGETPTLKELLDCREESIPTGNALSESIASDFQTIQPQQVTMETPTTTPPDAMSFPVPTSVPILGDANMEVDSAVRGIAHLS